MEKLYQYLWSHRMLGRTLRLRGGGKVEILNPGVLNRDSGPDFLGARVRLEDEEWAGNVEIHVKASDWYAHHHDRDRAYDSVILHVVAVDDRKVFRPDGNQVPQVEVTFPPEFYTLYEILSDNIGEMRCRPFVKRLDTLTVSDWLSSLAVERMQEKAERIRQILESSSGDWKQACFVAFARALGFGLNSDAFEMFARSIPLNHVLRHSDNLFQIEAMLFGQAGMLDMSVNILDEYYQSLCREYYFLAKKYGLRPMRGEIWKYARTRPGNFPHRRIAYLARFMEGGFSLLSDLMVGIRTGRDCREIFDRPLTGYWSDHYGFGSEEKSAPRALGEKSLDLLMINLVAPLIYAYSGFNSDYEGAEKGLDLWAALPPENNTYIRRWTSVDIKPSDAMQSQALIQLSKQYCDRHRCLDCRFGHSLLRKVTAQHSTK